MNDYSTKHKPTTIDVNRNNNIIPLKRTRAKRSCDFCRKRKARCDADHTIPCSNCKAWGFNCEFLTVRKKRGPPSVYVENLETRCKKMESLLTCLTKSTIKDIERNDFRAETYLNSNKRSVPHNYSTKEDDDGDDDDNDDDDADADMNEGDNDDDDGDNDDDSSFEGDNQSEHSNHAMQEIDNEVEDDESNIEETLANLNLDDYDSIKYTGLSAGLQLVDQNLFKSKSYVQLPGREHIALQLMSQNELLVVRSDPSSPGKKPDTRLDVGFSLTSTIFDKKKPNNTWYLSNDNNNSSKSISKDLPTKSVIDKAIKLYFSHIHLFLPIVNRVRFETHDKKSSNILVQAVLAVSFRFASRHFPKLFNKKTILYADIYFRKVMTKLQCSNRARLKEVQAALLMTLYLDMDEADVESMQWYTLGKAIRMAQDIGLHRSCSNWNLPASEIETRHRVFYACYILDRLMGARAGKPLTILDRDFDTDLPVPYEVYDDHREPGPSIYHSFIYLIELSEILGRVLKALYAPKSKHSNSNAGLDDPTILAVFDRRLKNWKASLDQSKDGIKISQAQKVNLLLFYYTVMLLLHRPFIEFSNNTTTVNIIHGSVDLDNLAKESRQACENAASSISVIVRQKQSLMSDPDSYSPLCLPTCFVYSMFQSSLIHLAIAIKNRDSLRRLRLLQRSIALLKQHEQLSSCQRAHNILVMLVTINGINLENLLENDTTKEEDGLHDDALIQQQQSPNLATKNHKELFFSSTSQLPQPQSLPPPHQQQQQQQIVNRNAVIPGCESTMPKSSWYQRMMNTSIIGGITPDLHQGLEEDGTSRTLEQLLPYATDMTHQPPPPPHHHHSRSDSNSTLYQHNRSDSNSTLYHPQENELQPSSNYYDVVMQNTAIVKNTKELDVYQHNRHHEFNDAGGNLRILQCDNNPAYGHNNVPTLLSHQHVPFTRNNLTATTGLPFSNTAAAAAGTTTTTTNFGNLNHTTSSHSLNNTSNTFPIHYLPPSNLNWSDWGIYLSQQNTTSIPTRQQPSNETSTENHLPDDE